MSEAERSQTLDMILPRLVNDERVRSALVERFGSRAEGVIRCVKAGETLQDQDKDALIEAVEEALIDHGQTEITYPDDVDPDGYCGEDNLIVYIKSLGGFFWIEVPDFDAHDAYFDNIENAKKYVEDEYSHMLDFDKDEES